MLEYSRNYRKATGSLWNYYRNEPSNALPFNSESFKYKTSITGNTYNLVNNDDSYDANKVCKNETGIIALLKHLSNFWRTLDMAWINCEIELILTWSRSCVLADMKAANNPPNELEFQIKDTAL